MAGRPCPKPPKRIRDPRFLASYKRGHPRCEACATARSDDVHHLRSRQMGGSDVPENVLALCRSCHRGWADVNRTRQNWLAQHAATMTDVAWEKVRRVLQRE